ncbi:hypothetical protein Tco_0625319 [Tanacetum coccineum]|uniref:Uncharacterized protein n=1 Tax=Tanacetum coccineum TaxID=301880 RepID=A0ABQ4WGJ3_9ASTR
MAGGSCKDDDDGVVGDEGVVGCASVVVGWQRAAGRRSAGAAPDIGRREGERQVGPHKGVKASANSDVMCFFTSAQDGDPSQDDVRLCLGDDLKKAQDHTRGDSSPLALLSNPSISAIHFPIIGGAIVSRWIKCGQSRIAKLSLLDVTACACFVRESSVNLIPLVRITL